MAKIALITGATGLLGRQVVKAFERKGWNVIGAGFSRANRQMLRVDLHSKSEIEAALDDVKPQVVVHCAAQRFPDKVDKDPDGARALNIDASKTLAQATSRRSILLIYISTDYVFSGKEGEAPYESDAATGPTNLYGQTKLDGEKVVLAETQDSGLGVVLRVPVLYGQADDPKESSINSLMDSVQAAQAKRTPVKMDDWSIRYPTNTEDVGRVCQDVAAKYLESTKRTALPKILQFSSEDKLTKYEICQIIADVMGLPLDGMEANKQGTDPSATVQRPYDCHLSTKALVDLGIDIYAQDFKAWWRWQVGAYRR